MRIEDQLRAGRLGEFGELRVPGDGGGRGGIGEGADDVGIRGVHRLHVGQLEPDRGEPACKQIVRDRQLDEIHRAALDVGKARCVLQHDAVIAVRIIAEDDRAGVLAAGGRDGQRIHVGDRHAVELAGVELVHRLDIVVDLQEVDVDAVFVGPFLHDAGLLGIGPRHPAGIDRPADREIVALGGLLCAAATGGGEKQGDGRNRQPRLRHPICHALPPASHRNARKRLMHCADDITFAQSSNKIYIEWMGAVTSFHDAAMRHSRTIRDAVLTGARDRPSLGLPLDIGALLSHDLASGRGQRR